LAILGASVVGRRVVMSSFGYNLKEKETQSTAG